MAEVRKKAIAVIKDGSGVVEGVLYSHRLEKIPPTINKERTWYTIEFEKPILIGERQLELIKGENILDNNGYQWKITQILENEEEIIYDSNIPNQ